MTEGLGSERDLARVIDLSTTDRFQQLVALVADGMVVVGQDGKVRFANPAAQGLLGTEGLDVIGDIVGLPVVRDATEIEIERSTAANVVVEMRVADIEWEGEEAIVASMRDVTGRAQLLRKQNEMISRLQELDELKTEFVSIVSHDLRSPVASIAGFADTLRLNWDLFPDDRKKQILARISKNTGQLAELVENVLQVSQIESGRLSYSIGDVDLKEIILRVVDENSLSVIADDVPRDIVLRLPERIPDVRADEVRQWQILTNLVTNALKFSPEDEPVVIGATVTDDEVQISVSDSGSGINEEDIHLLFQKFSRLEQPSGLKVKGSGLGLFICKAMVEAQGGKIWVESEPGAGSTFSYTVPVA